MQPAELENYLHQQIPLTKSMGLHVEFLNDHQLVLTAPLELNHNHLGTAFGGSLAALATSAAYGMLWSILQQPGVHIVIRSSQLSYLKPVSGPLRAICRRPPEKLITKFLKTFEQKDKARIDCSVTIEHADTVAMTFTGTFVALKSPS